MTGPSPSISKMTAPLNYILKEASITVRGYHGSAAPLPITFPPATPTFLPLEMKFTGSILNKVVFSTLFN